MQLLKNSLFLLAAGAMIFASAQLLAGCSKAYSGEKLFFTEGCSQCHTYKGKGGRMGPDLSAVTNIKSDSWIDSYIQDPKAMNHFARMPAFSHLSGAKRTAIITFLKE